MKIVVRKYFAEFYQNQYLTQRQRHNFPKLNTKIWWYWLAL